MFVSFFWSDTFNMITLVGSPPIQNNESKNTGRNGSDDHVVSLFHHDEKEGDYDGDVPDKFFNDPNVDGVKNFFSFV